MQADILILRPDACDLVKEDGKWLLGGGEKPPDVQANLARLRRVHDAERLFRGGPFRSYVICDEGSPVTFRVVGEGLVLTGRPYWYCWKTRTSDDEAFAKAGEEANRVGNERLRDLPGVGNLSDVEQDRRFQQFSDEAFSKAILASMPEFSRDLTDLIAREGGINPAVYQALTSTMQYAAFFRHVKQAVPLNWSEFLRSLEKIKPQPEVETPTVAIPRQSP
jgi:hypothetical protein